MHCRNFRTSSHLSRRSMLQACAMGFGGVAMRAMAGEEKTDFVDPLAPKPCHFPLGLKTSFSSTWTVVLLMWTPSITSRLLRSTTGRIRGRSLGNLPRLNSTRSGKSSRVRGNSSKGDRAGLGYRSFPSFGQRRSD